MNDTWGYKKNDNNWKSTARIVRMLADCASKGGNFLLNVGPTAEGLIPQASVERLAEVGQWMQVNRESIYGTSASPFAAPKWGRCTVKPGTPRKLYLHVSDWPKDGRLEIPSLRNNVTRAYLLADPAKALATARRGGDTSVTLPAEAPSKHDRVVVLEVDGAPDVAAP